MLIMTNSVAASSWSFVALYSTRGHETIVYSTYEAKNLQLNAK